MALALVPASVDVAPDESTQLDISRLWDHSFPSAQMVGAAASLLTRHRTPERVYVAASVLKSLELGHADPRNRAEQNTGRELTEGPRWRIEVAPGSVSVRRSDAARAERAANRAAEDFIRTGQKQWLEGPVCVVGSCAHQSCSDLRWSGTITELDRMRNAGELSPERERSVTSWSRRSRARMVQRLAELDYAPLFAGGGVPAMVTLTLPGDWQSVAPDAATAAQLVRKLQLRFRRAYGVPIVGVWKREFQRRGAPHWHILMVPPSHGPAFRLWLSVTWAEVVKAEHCGCQLVAAGRLSGCGECERSRHTFAGTGIDYAEGLRAKDPKRLGVYFSKHGSFSAKDYQNEAPAEWQGGSVGRFWGVWGLSPAIAAVEVAPGEALAAVRILRRYSRAHRNRKVSKSRHRLMSYGAGSLLVNDGAAVAAQLARALDRLYRPESIVGRSGAGPLGFLP